ncbi:Neuronal acetylcholine receptor subunit alpha-7 [Galemys pyrenaicus]|uniref:Neuronal acetylcholine receptor subunit alpha-7 n=1 Tax=Galemys pyrenaicus TaxID=202257 RepID=A0A8J6B1T3_GALPY|nr:Neuronal acetylcholine receptor subunit alpha-7 [Galemys pyrenaicus]
MEVDRPLALKRPGALKLGLEGRKRKNEVHAGEIDFCSSNSSKSGISKPNPLQQFHPPEAQSPPTEPSGGEVKTNSRRGFEAEVYPHTDNDPRTSDYVYIPSDGMLERDENQNMSGMISGQYHSQEEGCLPNGPSLTVLTQEHTLTWRTLKHGAEPGEAAPRPQAQAGADCRDADRLVAAPGPNMRPSRRGIWLVLAASLLHVSLQGEFQRKLYKELVKNYNPLERPVANDSLPLTVYFSLSLMQIMDVNDPLLMATGPALKQQSTDGTFIADDQARDQEWIELKLRRNIHGRKLFSVVFASAGATGC